MNLLSTAGEHNWIMYWKYIKKPTNWSKLPNALSHWQSFMFSDGLRLAMLMPFILCRCFTPSCIKSCALESLKNKLEIRNDEIVLEVIRCWVIVAKAAKLSFSTVFTDQTYKELEECLHQEQDILTRVLIYNFFDYSNSDGFYLQNLTSLLLCCNQSSLYPSPAISQVFTHIYGADCNKTWQSEHLIMWHKWEAIRSLTTLCSRKTLMISFLLCFS